MSRIGRPSTRVQLICVSCKEPFLVIAYRAEKAKTCSPKCRGREQTIRLQRPLLDRFWEKVDRRGPDDCWPWLGSKDEHGYGHIWLGLEDPRIGRATHVALLTVGVVVRKGYEAMHSCDNPPCCNPAHLSEGTKKQNQEDKARKGRARTLPRFGKDNPMYGHVKSLEERFFEKIDRRGESDCWPWTAASQSVWDGKRYARFTKISLRLAGIGVNEDRRSEITQVCGNDLCGNPAHLKIIRKIDNPLRKGHSNPNAIKGELHCRAKLKEADVRAIRGMRPSCTIVDIANLFGISKSLVRAIIARRIWRHVA